MVFVLLIVLLTFAAMSGCSRKPETKLWSNLCAACHNGKTAPTSDVIRDKYRTTEEFAVAVKARGHRCMNILKNDNSLIRKVAREIGLKD
ncbi:MAG: hypothetical protein P8013_10465 [Candidatus Sulfobium sp.]